MTGPSEISATDLRRMRDAGEPCQVVDVRESYEVEVCSIGGQHIPLGELIERLADIRRDVPVVIHCRSGRRGAAATEALRSRYGFTNVRNLSGGILAWAAEVDPTINCDR